MMMAIWLVMMSYHYALQKGNIATSSTVKELVPITGATSVGLVTKYQIRL